MPNIRFKRCVVEAIRNLVKDEHFTDVILATGDKKQIKAPKINLGSNSQFFKNILIQNSHHYPLIYIKDISYA